MVQQFLSSNGIHAEVFGSKEYGSHVTGFDYGIYEVKVASDQFSAAEKLLSESKKLSEVEGEVARPVFYLKRAVMYSMFAMFMMPLIFNYYSLKNLFVYIRHESNFFKRTGIGIIVLFLQIPAVVLVYFIIQTALD